MPEKYDGLLDTGRLEEVSLDSKTWLPVRASRWSFDLVRPSFLNRRHSGPKKPKRRTAWLDGLRGFAAFLVFIHHQQLWAHDAENVMGLNHIFENAFGYEGNYYFASMPFVRTFFTGGHYAVAVFFVISGYVLSNKPLSLIQNGEVLKAADNLGSAMFRRWLRLYIPVILVTFLFMCQWHLIGVWSVFGVPKETFREDIWNWYAEFKNFSFAFNTGEVYRFTFQYHAHVWSIAIEFRGSIIVYTALMAFARCSKKARLWCEVGLMYYFMYIADGWYGAMFMAGMMLCDLDLLADAEELPRFFTVLEGFKELIFFHLFVLSLYLGGVPARNSDVETLARSPGWVWLSWLKPQAVFDYKWFYLFWAAVLLVAAIPRLPWLKHFFETRFCQYLARISFALYLVHGPVIWLIGDRLYSAVGYVRDSHKIHIPGWIEVMPMSRQGPLGLEPAFLAPQLIILPVTLWVAELVTKLFDEPSVKIANWLYTKTLAPHTKA